MTTKKPAEPEFASKKDLKMALVTAIKGFQDAVDRFDAAAARKLKVNETGFRCLTNLNDRGPQQASQIAMGLGLTRGATTTALNQLVAAQRISRSANKSDGRSVIIDLTDSASEELKAVWTPLRTLGQKMMDRFSKEELQVVLRFFQDGAALQRVCEERILAELAADLVEHLAKSESASESVSKSTSESTAKPHTTKSTSS